VDTFIDGKLQRDVETLAQGEARWFGDGANIAAIVVENSTRRVRAYLGGIDYFGRRAGQVDLARAARSPGSALKPFIYGMAFDDGFVHPASLIDDEPTRFGDYAPKDFDRDYRGTVSVREALVQSLNVPAVAVLERVGPMRFVADLRAAGARLSTRRLAAPPACRSRSAASASASPISPCSMPGWRMAARSSLWFTPAPRRPHRIA